MKWNLKPNISNNSPPDRDIPTARRTTHAQRESQRKALSALQVSRRVGSRKTSNEFLTFSAHFHEFVLKIATLNKVNVLQNVMQRKNEEMWKKWKNSRNPQPAAS